MTPSDVVLQGHMERALALAVSPGSMRGPNPRVGCVVLDVNGQVVGEGWHRGAGTAHAEVDALAAAGGRARAGTAIVTLEPCRHVGRTGPCTSALIDAGIVRVVYAQSDPTAAAGGGAQVLADAGVEVIGGLLADRATEVNRGWTTVQLRGRPFVIVKTAMSIDGRVADASGGPTRITGDAARRHAHRVRGEVDAIIVGTGTVLADDPHLTARTPTGELAPSQPLRVVMGTRPLPTGAHVLDSAAGTLVLPTHELEAGLAELAARGVQEALVEGGPTLVRAFLDAGLVDAIQWYVAPLVLGGGPRALPDGPAITLDVRHVERVGEDVLVEGRIARPEGGSDDVHRDR